MSMSTVAAAPAPPRPSRWRDPIVRLGKAGDRAARDAYEVIGFLAHAINATVVALVRPRYLRLSSISRQVAETGVNALPTVGLLAIMISVVIAYQGVAQLRPYGAENLTID